MRRRQGPPLRSHAPTVDPRLGPQKREKSVRTPEAKEIPLEVARALPSKRHARKRPVILRAPGMRNANGPARPHLHQRLVAGWKKWTRPGRRNRTKRRKRGHRRLPCPRPIRARFDIWMTSMGEEDGSHNWNLSQLDKEWVADKQNYDNTSIFGMRVLKVVPATQFTQNSVAGVDTMNLPVHHLLYKAQKGYDLGLIANGGFCSLVCVRSLIELYSIKALLRILRDRNYNVDVKELLAAVARDKNAPEPRINSKRKELMELLVQDYVLPKLQELVSWGRLDPQVARLRKIVADLQRQLAVAKGTDAAAVAVAREEPAAAMDHVDKYRRPAKMAKTPQAKFADSPNSRTATTVVKNMQLSMDQQKVMAGHLIELKHLTSPTKGSAGEPVIPPAVAQATQREIRKIVGDWGLPARFLGAVGGSVPATVLELLAMCTTIAQSGSPP